MQDLISRQAAIDAVKKNTFRLTFAEEQNCEGHVAWSAEAVYSDVMEGALLELPSAQPEPHEGHWIPVHPQILDDAEKRYLSAVIRPFRDRVQYIKKIDGACEEYIYIQLNKDWAFLPRFKEGTMYKGMKPDHAYTLEELGL